MNTPRTNASPGADPPETQAARAAFLEAVRNVPDGAQPDLVVQAPATAEAGSAAASAEGLSAADLTLDLARSFGDVEPLREALLRDDERRLVRPAASLSSPPGAALGPGELYVLARADGTLTRPALVAASPAGEEATLRALCGLEALGMVASAPVAARAAAAQGSKARDLDSFLSRTAGVEAGSAPTGRATRYTPEEQQQRNHLTEMFRSSAGKDAYGVLGVTPSAQESEIRSAYYSLAKKYHPDQLRKPHLEDLLHDIEVMFASMTEAYNTLGHPQRRQEYDRARQEAAAGRKKETSDPVAVARDVYLRGRREMDAGHTFEAIRLFEAATQNDPSRFEYFHFLGVCQGQNPRWRKKAEENLLKAISMNPSTPQAYIELARIYHKGGLARRAHEMYEQALKWEPDNQEALEALGRGGGKDATATGLLRSIFRKD